MRRWKGFIQAAAATVLLAAGIILSPSSAMAQVTTVGVTADSPTSVTGCTAPSTVSPRMIIAGFDYVFDAPYGATSCDATIIITFNLPGGTPDTGPTLNFQVFGNSAFNVLSSGGGQFSLSDTNLSATVTLLMNTSHLQPGDNTFTTYVEYTGCTGDNCGSITSFTFSPGTPTYMEIESDVFVDGQDTLDIGAQPSSATSPVTPGLASVNSPSGAYQWQYVYHIKSGQSVNDNFNVNLSVDDTDPDGDSFRVTPDNYSITTAYDAVDSSSAFSTLNPTINSPTVPLVEQGPGQTVNIAFNTGPLTVTTTTQYAIVFNVSGIDNSGSAPLLYADTGTACVPGGDGCPSDQKIRVLITVAPAGAAPNTCFFTDGDFNFLKDCSGKTVPTSTNPATFQIVPGERGDKTIVATNPGEFFYNMLWKNTGTTLAEVDFTATAANLVSEGDEPVHGALFDSNGFVANQTGFDTVTGTGTPCGDPLSAGTSCTFSVGAGQVLWIVWHVKYASIGGSTSIVSTGAACPTNLGTGTPASPGPIIYVDAILTNEADQSTFECKSSAGGYLKH